MKRRLVFVAVMAALGFLLTILVFIPRPPSPAITVRHIKSVQYGGVVLATFEITNHTGSVYHVYPFLVEVRNGPLWRTCFLFNSASDLEVGPSGYHSITLQMADLPTGSPLRLTMQAHKELKAGLVGLFERFEMRFRFGVKSVSVNPFRKTGRVFSRPTELLSQEFIEPVLKEREPEGSKK
jgi:hypothetical protein